MHLTDFEKDIVKRIEQLIHEGKLSNDFLVQNIELCGKYLNLTTISDYAKQHKISYNGVKKFRKIINLFNVKFVIDND